MKVSIIGAAGAGKSNFAKKLATELKKDGYKVKVVDNVVQNLETKTGYAYGIWAAFPQNFQILFDRWTKEQEAANKGAEIVISVGSIYESILWSALYASQEMFRNDMIAHASGQAAITGLGMIESLIGPEYETLFYLPYPNDKIFAEDELTYDTVVNYKILEVAKSYFRKVNSLTGTDKRNVENAADIIRLISPKSDDQTSENDGSSVRGSGTPPEEGSKEL